MKRYENLDGLRTIAAICIIAMHVLVNGKYEINSLAGNVIGTFGVFVKLFFIISGFGMCCGYYEKFKSGNYSLNNFYNKRYLRILPYFTILILLDVALSRFNSDSVIQGFSNMTLLFGLFPSYETTVIGVCWTLGAIFAFYILFPFIVYMLWNKGRAWAFFIISLIIHYICNFYLEASACNIALQLCWFMAGCMIYLYKDIIEKIVSRYSVLFGMATIAVVLGWWFIPDKIGMFNISTIKTMIMFSMIVCYAISVKRLILSNKLTRFVSNISFEIYLAHMVFYRVFEKLKILYIFGNGKMSYITSLVGITISVMIFAYVVKRILNLAEQKLLMRRN